MRWIDGGIGLLEGFGQEGWGFKEKAGECIGRNEEIPRKKGRWVAAAGRMGHLPNF